MQNLIYQLGYTVITVELDVAPFLHTQNIIYVMNIITKSSIIKWGFTELLAQKNIMYH